MKTNSINSCAFAAMLLMFSPLLLASAQSDYELGVKSYKAGDNAAAVVYFESAMQQGMDSVSLQYNLASSYYRVGRYGDAKKYFKFLKQTEAMRDIAEYHLGLIAIKEKNGSLARRYFSSVVNSGKDEKLVKLSEKHLITLSQIEDRWKNYFSFNLGHDDNISSVSGDSVLGIADTFYDVAASTELLVSGIRMDGWVANAALFGIDYSDADTNDEYHFTLGMKRTAKLSGWDFSVHPSLLKSTYGGDAFQSIAKLDVKGQVPISDNERINLSYRVESIKSENSLYDYLEGWRQRARAEYRQYSQQNIKQFYYELELNNRGELVTPTYIYDYSPTRHTVRGKYTQVINKQWWLTGDVSYQNSDFEVSPTIDREDDQWKLGISVDYYFDRTFKMNAKYQYTDNTSTVDRYSYDKTIMKIGLSKLF